MTVATLTIFMRTLSRSNTINSVTARYAMTIWPYPRNHRFSVIPDLFNNQAEILNSCGLNAVHGRLWHRGHRRGADMPEAVKP
jgi:hypothetical protein